MTVWEYEVIQLSGSKDEDMIPLLDIKGDLQWELVSVVVNPIPVDKRIQYLAFFKRPQTTS